jgi:hypothetical protein
MRASAGQNLRTIAGIQGGSFLEILLNLPWFLNEKHLSLLIWLPASQWGKECCYALAQVS